MSTPLTLMVPPVGSISRRTVRPTVDLPQPDSPTRPSVSPLSIEKLTPSTANTVPAACCNSPLRIGKCFFRSRTSSTVAAGATPVVGETSGIAVPVELVRAPARRPMTGALLLVGRIGLPATVFGVRTARRKHAAVRQVRQGRDHAGNFLEPCAGFYLLAAHQRKARDRSHQPVRVGMLRPHEQLLDRRLLDLAAGVHDDDALRGLGDDAKVVGEQDDGGAERTLEVEDDVEDLRLDG